MTFSVLGAKKYDMKKTILLADDPAFHDGDIFNYVYGKDRLDQIASISNCISPRLRKADISKDNPLLSEVEVIFSTWGMPALTEEEIQWMPNLEAVFYAAGSVNGFAEPFLKNGIRVSNGIEANAVPVAEFCLAQILLSLKGAYRNSFICKQGTWDQSKMPVGRGVYGETVALLGIGAISRHLLHLLKPFNVRVVAVSSYLNKDPELAKSMGIDALVTIEEAFEQAFVVSNHLADKETNRGILNKSHFASMREGATFINTGRGAQVVEEDLISVLKSRKDLTALLDVQHPEPPVEGSAFFDLENVYMTSHIAGSANDEVKRMADYVIEDFQRWEKGEAMQYEVTLEDLGSRA